eukprot:300045-Rhodomonas_salina.3
MSGTDIDYQISAAGACSLKPVASLLPKIKDKKPHFQSKLYQEHVFFAFEFAVYSFAMRCPVLTRKLMVPCALLGTDRGTSDEIGAYHAFDLYCLVLPDLGSLRLTYIAMQYPVLTSAVSTHPLCRSLLSNIRYGPSPFQAHLCAFATRLLCTGYAMSGTHTGRARLIDADRLSYDTLWQALVDHPQVPAHCEICDGEIKYNKNSVWFVPGRPTLVFDLGG